MRARNRDQDSLEDLMLPRDRKDSARALEGRSAEMHPRYGDRAGGDEKVSASASTRNTDKIRCLDGLRGIACLIVFNYHFFWPWTPAIMMGYGALPPRAPEPYWGWQSLPIICLVHRGRPMVAIFFAISGYVLCRHILRSIHERRLDAAYQSLASAVFRRVFRLYIPPTISMFMVAMLAQMGAFRSEKAIYKGPDSAYINGTVITAELKVNATCPNGTFPAVGVAGVADFLHLQTPIYLANATSWDNTTTWNDTLCLNQTSELFGPSSLYKLVDELESLSSNDTMGLNDTMGSTLTTRASLKDKEKSLKDKKKTVEDKGSFLKEKGNFLLGKGNYNKGKGSKNKVDKTKLVIEDALNVTESLNLTWVKFGGSWEEHPFIHDNMTYALKNFTRAYAEWANPFNFGHYHPRYDPHTFTIPMELRGSMFIYIFLLGTAALKAKWRLRIAGFLSAYSLTLGRWDMATFLGGTLLSEIDIRNSSGPGQMSPSGSALVPPVTSRQANIQRLSRREKVMRGFVFFVALYFLSYPDAGAEYTPGFVFLSSLVPKYYIPLSGWMFYQSMGALMLLHCILRSPLLCRFLEGRAAQYLGKISFSLYLVHGPVLHSLGFWIMPRLFDHFGRTGGYTIGYVILLSVTLYLTNWWYRKIDVWSITVGRRIERQLVE